MRWKHNSHMSQLVGKKKDGVKKRTKPGRRSDQPLSHFCHAIIVQRGESLLSVQGDNNACCNHPQSIGVKIK